MRKKLIFWLCSLYFLQLAAITNATPLLRFKISRPYCVLNFLETCKGAMGTSEYLKQYIEDNTKADPAFKQLIDDYSALNIDANFLREGFPETRPSYRSTKDLLIIAAVQSDNLSDFKDRTIGVLHNTDYYRLMDLMRKADVFYERIIWSKHGKSALKQLKKMEEYQNSANIAFLKLKNFYHSSWSDDMPFTVALTPVPGKNGSTAATPHANSLCVDILTEETNYAGRVAIVLHEICHVLYAEQSRQFQHELESWFAAHASPYTAVAHNFFDEGLATACGNGWAYQLLTGKLDSMGWYSDPYIDGFGHALFPLVQQYLQAKKSLDNAFVKEAVKLFGERFPNSPQDYGVQFNHLTMYSDEERPTERNQIKSHIYAQFMVSWLNFSTPILEKESVSFLKESGGTQLVIVDRNYETVFDSLKSILPDLKHIPYNLNEDFVINYYDPAKRLIIIAKINSGDTANLFKAFKKKQFVDTGNQYWKL